MTAKVRVQRNPRRSTDQPWLVLCDICQPEIAFGVFGAVWFGGPGLKGWAPTWRIAQNYAARHALAHETTRCSTCLHVPHREIVDERASA